MQTGRYDLFVMALDRRGLPADALDPAISAGLIAIDGRVDFFHPLLRSAIYHAADPVQRRSVHATLGSLPGAPARRAWHLAAAADAPDEEVAAALEVAAGEARARGGVTAGARAFERAASLSTDDEARARRLLEAASDFAQGGLVDHALDLVSTAQELVPGGALATEVVRVRGRVEMRRGAPGHRPRPAGHRGRPDRGRQPGGRRVAARRGGRRPHDDGRHGGLGRHRRPRAGALAGGLPIP